MYKDQLSTVPQQHTAFSIQEAHSPNAKFITRSTYDEPRKICPQGTQPTRMQAHQATQATACPLHPRVRQGPRRSHEVAKPPNQDFPWEGHHTQLSGVAWEWDPWGLSYACDSDTGCHEEEWSFQGLRQGPEGLSRSQESGWVGRAGLALLKGTSAGMTSKRKNIRSSTMSLTTLILCQIILKYMF